MSTSLLNIQRDRKIRVLPSADRRNDVDFGRETSERYDLDHTEAVQIGPVQINPATTLVVPLQGLTTARFLYLESDVDVQLDLAGQTILLKPPKVPSGGTARLARIEADVEFAALSITNPGASAACVTGYMIGD